MKPVVLSRGNKDSFMNKEAFTFTYILKVDKNL